VLAEQLVGIRPTAVLLGQYLSALELITQEEEEQLHVRCCGPRSRPGTAACCQGAPSAPSLYSESLEQAARELGVEFTVLNSPVLAETLYAYARPSW